MKLIHQYNKNKRGWWKTDWLWMEILDGSSSLSDASFIFYKHPDYDLVKMKFTLITCKVDGKTIEFVNKGKLLVVHSKDGWKKINDK
ncbi:hypothetical protein V7056_15165 [Bacillus sp. JJ664]